jgi:hypothetical protein
MHAPKSVIENATYMCWRNGAYWGSFDNLGYDKVCDKAHAWK